MDYSTLQGGFWGLNLNAEADPDWPTCRQILIDLQSRVNLVMNGPGRALEIAEMLPNSITSNRQYHADDTEYWLRRSAAQAADDIIAGGAIKHDRVWNEKDCEPKTAGYTDKWVDWTIEVADRLGNKGYHYVTAIAVGKTLFRKSMESDAWTRFIRALHENPYLHLGVHEYGYIFPMAQWMGNYPYNMFDGAAMHPDNWPTSIPRERKADGTMPDNWHLGRTEWLQIRSEELGYGRIPYIITEAMHDNMDDVSRFNYVGVSGAQPLKGWVKQFNGGDDVSGINSLHGLYKHVLPQYTPSALFYKQLEWANRIYGPECIGAALFTWSKSQDWRRFAVQDERLRGTFTLLKNLPIRKGIGMTDAPDTKPIYPGIPTDDSPDWGQPETIEPGGKENNTFFNTRNLPSTTNGDIVRKVDGEVLVSLHKTVTWPDDRKRGTWRVLRFPNGQKLWAADWVFLSVAGDEPEIPEEPEPEPEPEPTPDSEPEPEPIPDEVEYLPLEIYLQMPIDYFPADEGHRIGKTLVFLAYVLWAVGYALQGKVYKPVITDMSKGLVDIKAEAAKKKITQTMRAVKPEEAA